MKQIINLTNLYTLKMLKEFDILIDNDQNRNYYHTKIKDRFFSDININLLTTLNLYFIKKYN